MEANVAWVHFVLMNTDIMTSLSEAPLVLTCIAPGRFSGRIFGVSIDLEAVGEDAPNAAGKVRFVADVKMPFGLGRTNTIARYNYTAVDLQRTAVDLELTLEISPGPMSAYARWRRDDIDSYLNRVLLQNERTAQLLESAAAELKRLPPDQIERIEKFRRLYAPKSDTIPGQPRTVSINPAVETIPPESRPWDSELTMLTSFYQSITGEARKLEDELIRIRDTRDAVATLLISRRMLELIVTQICESQLGRDRGSEPLANLLDKFMHQKVVPEYVLASMNNLNRLSTFGAHPKDFSVIQVKEALLGLCAIMEWYVKAPKSAGTRQTQ